MASGKVKSLLISELILRRVVGILGIALPFAVVIAAGFIFQSSISDFYYTPSRNLFVGTMCAVGVFLCCYKGYDIKDWVFCLVAGIAAILVALCPVAQEGDTIPADQVRSGFHLFFAAVFLGSLAYLSLCQFTKTDPKKKMTAQKVERNRVYRACGWVMVACLLTIVLIDLPFTASLKSSLKALNPVFFLESFSVIAFGFSWLTKGEGLWGDKSKAKP
jgi:hypothetical protein